MHLILQKISFFFSRLSLPFFLPLMRSSVSRGTFKGCSMKHGLCIIIFITPNHSPTGTESRFLVYRENFFSLSLLAKERSLKNFGKLTSGIFRRHFLPFWFVKFGGCRPHYRKIRGGQEVSFMYQKERIKLLFFPLFHS